MDEVVMLLFWLSGVSSFALPPTGERSVVGSVLDKPTPESVESSAVFSPRVLPSDTVAVICARHGSNPMAMRQTQNKKDFIKKRPKTQFKEFSPKPLSQPCSKEHLGVTPSPIRQGASKKC